ncbi:heavy metal translocating P-type ATPase [Oceanivirga miroungae]|uniref:Mg2+ transport protein n=1 Tax=Oceanivirga miroungae TaxID=1130046 RepID=A0A6I8ME21_9FUSO|nr:cation-translocating P-type ATPase [Oceanivirga miroungae]VWL85351.1 Mg2+ transport protein [Oceanivirga miroungae]
MQKKVYKVENMSCASCVNIIETTLEKKGYKAKVNLISEKMVVYLENEDKELKSIMSKIGYDIKDSKDNEEPKKEVPILKLLTLFIFMIVIMLKIPISFKLIISSISIFLCREILIDGYKKTVSLKFNMYSLILIGVMSAYLYSIVMMYNSRFDRLYFDGISVILFVISLGNQIEAKLKKNTKESIEKITQLLPSHCNILVNNEIIKIETKNLKVDDILVVKEGEVVASDGIVVSGIALVNESSITGESKDIEKIKDDNIIGSSVITKGQVNVKIKSVGENTVVSKIASMMEMTQLIKPNIARFADKVAMYFVPGVLIIATITGVLWYLLTKDLEKAFNNFASVILISCPCSIGLATPASISLGGLLLSKRHILIKNPEALEIGYKITDVVMDKTGTLTNGTPVVSDIMLDKNYYNDIYSIEKYIEHPISNAICNYLEAKTNITFSEKKVRNFQGLGVFSESYLIGNRNLMTRRNIDVSKYEKEYEKFSNQGKTFIFIAKDKDLIGYITIIDDIKDSSLEFITYLKNNNMKAYMLTGDNKMTARYIADKLGIKELSAEVLPYEKVEFIEKVKTHDNFVAMVGDGVNDAAALKASDIGFCVSNASDISLKAADVILLKNDLNDIIKFKNISYITMKNIKENLFFGFIYNVFGIVIATGVLGIELTPTIASICMVCSSISVLLNSIRLKLYKGD